MTKNTNISERISELIGFLSITPNSFAMKLGYPRSQTIYDIINGKSSPSYDFFHRLASSEYSALININYILSGKGEISSAKPEPAFVNEPYSNYNKTCKLCEEKDKRIDDLLAQIERLSLIINKLTSNDSEQKRRAG
jgi:transcriptional regulator with XRE-family HTH domain